MRLNYKTLSRVTCIFSIFFCGCMLKYEDVSKSPEYAPLLNTRYSLATNMLVYGVNLPPGYGKKIDIYMIDPVWPKVKGPEIISDEILKAGTILDVQGVRKSVNHLPGYQSIQAFVNVSSFEKAVDVPVVINLKYIQSTNYMEYCSESDRDN